MVFVGTTVCNCQSEIASGSVVFTGCRRCNHCYYSKHCQSTTLHASVLSFFYACCTTTLCE